MYICNIYVGVYLSVEILMKLYSIMNFKEETRLRDSCEFCGGLEKSQPNWEKKLLLQEEDLKVVCYFCGWDTAAYFAKLSGPTHRS